MFLMRFHAHGIISFAFAKKAVVNTGNFYIKLNIRCKMPGMAIASPSGVPIYQTGRKIHNK